MEKKDFVGIMLKDLSELKFNKAYKVLFAILGCALPMLPLIFFYGQHWFKRYELTGTLIIILIINAMLLIGNASIFIYARFKKSRKMFKEVEKDKKNIDEEITKLEKDFEKDFNTESVINYGVKIALVFNVVIGLFVVFLKVLDVIFNICFLKCDFRGIIIVVVMQFVILNLICAWWVLRGEL